MIYQIDPTGIFEQNPAKGGVCRVIPFGIAVAAGATTNIIAGVTNQITMIVTMYISAFTADATFQIDSKPSGAATILMDGWVAHKVDKWFNEPKVGVLRANAAGDIIRLTAGATSIVNVYGQYITYTP